MKLSCSCREQVVERGHIFYSIVQDLESFPSFLIFSGTVHNIIVMMLLSNEQLSNVYWWSLKLWSWDLLVRNPPRVYRCKHGG